MHVGWLYRIIIMSLRDLQEAANPIDLFEGSSQISEVCVQWFSRLKDKIQDWSDIDGVLSDR